MALQKKKKKKNKEKVDLHLPGLVQILSPLNGTFSWSGSHITQGKATAISSILLHIQPKLIA